MTFTGVSIKKVRQGGVNSLRLASSNNSGKLGGIEVMSSCLVRGPGVIKAEEHCLWWHNRPDGRDVALDWLVCTSKGCSQLSPLLTLKTG